MARQSRLLRGVRSVRMGAFLAVEATGAVFFAGLAATDEFANRHNKLTAATKESVSAKRAFRSMAVRV